jgi:hypothetical protein
MSEVSDEMRVFVRVAIRSLKFWVSLLEKWLAGERV